MNASWVTKFAVTVPSASIYQVLISACARTDTAAILIMDFVLRHKRDVPMIMNARPMRSACSLESVYVHHRSIQIP